MRAVSVVFLSYYCICAHTSVRAVSVVFLSSHLHRGESERGTGAGPKGGRESLEVVRDRRYVYDARYAQDGRLYIYTEEGPERSFSTASQRQ